MNARDALILEWHKAQTTLALAKEAESLLRAQVIAAEFQPEPLSEGTRTIELGQGYRLKAGFKASRKFTLDSDAMIDFLAQLESDNPESAEISQNAVRWKAELALTHYRSLPTDLRAKFDAIIVAKDDMPTLELVIPTLE